ncbi:phage tail fiber protein [Pseudomonas frederiksbergensis]|uniref:phage tail fiber protein n=1 Tax=Pseudomonas frederiksbergensis TaxID=104087 RepID=UPI0008FB7DF6|nr:hypothetical protein [Pseudomonas frederiksbergensis]
MSKQTIQLGTPPSGVGGDTPRSANIKIAANFDELYSLLGGDTLTTPKARVALGLGSAATLNAGRTIGGLAKAEDLGWAQTADPSKSWMADASPGFDSNLYGPGSPGAPTGGTGYYYKQTIRFGAGFNRLIIAWPYGTGGSSGTIKFQSIYGDNATPFQEIYHTGNTTRGSGGVLSAASPILRIANVADSQRRDLQEQIFEPSGEWGVSNSEARGVSVERLGVGEYRVTGSLGLALEGWRTQDPCSPDGGRTLGITESQQAPDGTIVIKLFKRRWTLSEDGEMIPGRGAPLDVPLSSWIDVRLEMPRQDTPPLPPAA